MAKPVHTMIRVRDEARSRDYYAQEARAAAGVSRRDRDLYQPGAERGGPAERAADGEARAPPFAGTLGDRVDAHGADDGVRVASESREGADRNGVRVDGVPVVVLRGPSATA